MWIGELVKRWIGTGRAGTTNSPIHPPAGPLHPQGIRMNRAAVNPKEIEGKVVEALKTCYDPEIPVNIYELGLIYHVGVNPSGVVEVQMTLTSPNCPSAAELPLMAEAKIRSIAGVTDARVEVVFDPPWEPSRMSEAARLELGML